MDVKRIADEYLDPEAAEALEGFELEELAREWAAINGRYCTALRKVIERKKKPQEEALAAFLKKALELGEKKLTKNLKGDLTRFVKNKVINTPHIDDVDSLRLTLKTLDSIEMRLVSFGDYISGHLVSIVAVWGKLRADWGKLGVIERQFEEAYQVVHKKEAKQQAQAQAYVAAMIKVSEREKARKEAEIASYMKQPIIVGYPPPAMFSDGRTEKFRRRI
jgi:hypothetical protein